MSHSLKILKIISYTPPSTHTIAWIEIVKIVSKLRKKCSIFSSTIQDLPFFHIQYIYFSNWEATFKFFARPISGEGELHNLHLITKKGNVWAFRKYCESKNILKFQEWKVAKWVKGICELKIVIFWFHFRFLWEHLKAVLIQHLGELEPSSPTTPMVPA